MRYKDSLYFVFFSHSPIDIDYSTIPLTQTFEIICSLPLLEGLDIMGCDIDYDHRTPPFRPQTSPPLTGTLSLDLPQGLQRTMNALLGMPNGVHFRKFVCTRHLWVHLEFMMTLVEACSHTLEYIDIKFHAHCMFLLLRGMNSGLNVCQHCRVNGRIPSTCPEQQAQGGGLPARSP